MKLEAKSRGEHGRGASRRLRRNGLVPAILYGKDSQSEKISLDHNTLYYALNKPSFHTSVLTITFDGKEEKALLRDYQMHAFRPQILHLDFQRVNSTDEINLKVPLHFINEDISKAVKTQGAHITKIITEVEIRAKLAAIPQNITVDLKSLSAGQSIHLSNLLVPEGVVLTNLLRDDDSVVVTAAGIAEISDAIDSNVVSASDVPTIGGDKNKD